MRISKYYKLNRSQPALDFVDGDIHKDVRVFIDPQALRLLPSDWGQQCVSLIQSFFKEVLKALKLKDNARGTHLLLSLREPNETHLGLSKGKSRGRALGPETVKRMWDALKKSQAAASGLIEDLEDTILMIEGISNDIISDIATNIIRGPLIEYTQATCRRYGIPMDQAVESGPVWNPKDKDWMNGYTELPMTDAGKLVLVPKVIVRKKLEYDDAEYLRHYILTYLIQAEMKANTELVQLIKSGKNRGKKRVYKTDLLEKYGTGKALAIKTTLENPDLLKDYRRDKSQKPTPPLSHWQLTGQRIGEDPDWDALLKAVTALPNGRDTAGQYEDAVEQLLTALFYPSLAHPMPQLRIHDGRKRIDISYVNLAQSGFFEWLSKHYTAPHVFVECKNYSGDVGNPELDQLSSRFSPSRGEIGLLVHRQLADKQAFTARCRDTAKDNRGFIIPLDDADLSELVQARKADDRKLEFDLLKKKFDTLIM